MVGFRFWKPLHDLSAYPQVTPPPAGAGGFFGLQAQIRLSPAGCRYISRQESGVLCGWI